MLALHDAKSPDLAARALREWPSRDGLLLERRDGDPNYGFQGIALLTLMACGVDHVTGNAALVAGIQRVQGITTENTPIFRQDNTLVGWSWIPNTFGWVEPTAWCLLALKRVRSAGAAIDRTRIDQAEKLILDRTCKAGGWNYGNSNVLGQELQPYVSTTAIALLAMQDRAAEPSVQRSLIYLEQQGLSERSGLSMALAALALRLHGRDTDAIGNALIQQLPVTTALENTAAVAAALYSLQPDRGYGAFRI